jgi:hypothetical protein
MTAQELLETNGIQLRDYSPGKYATICPECSHDRKKRKVECLSIKIDAQGAVWNCHHCGWSGPGKGSGKGKANGRGGGFAGTYDYLGFQKVRFPKGHDPRFAIRHRVGNSWKWGAGGADTKVLYRKDEVDEAIAAGHTILVVEGEKDVDRLWSIGIPATCNAHGAADPTKNQQPKWKAEHSEQLRGAAIVVIPDHDNAGYAHADATCKLSLGVAKSVRRLVLRDHWQACPKGGDVSDYLDAGHTREDLDALIEQALDYAPGTSKAYAPGPGAGSGGKAHVGEDLKRMTFDPIKYVVPSVIVEGLTILAGKPKLGKSWLMLHATLAVARGGFTLGNMHCIEGDVLYCALEDNERRLQSRMTKLLGIVPDWPKRFHYFCLNDDFPRLNDGGIDWLKEWIDSVPAPRLIVIDTFVTVRAPKKNNQPNYDADYESGKELQKLANERGIAIVIVHHLRKAEADDAYDTVNATLGLNAVVDAILVLKRETSGGIALYGRGRDLVEIEKALEFNQNACTWTIVGNAADIRLTKEREMILEALEEAGAPIGPSAIAAATGMKAANIRFLLGKLLKEGLVKKEGYGKYRKV